MAVCKQCNKKFLQNKNVGFDLLFEENHDIDTKLINKVNIIDYCLNLISSDTFPCDFPFDILKAKH